MKTITAARWVSLVAAFIVGAVAEYKLARQVGYDQYTAALLPLVLDVWGFAAFRSGRTWHVVGALSAMFLTQMVSHLLTLGEAPALMVILSIAVSAIPPAVSLACHRLGKATSEDVSEATEATEEDAAAVIAFPVLDVAEDDEEEGSSPTAHVVKGATGIVTTPTVPSKPRKGSGLSQEEVARRGRELLAQGMKKYQAAHTLGVSRQWLNRCLERYPAEATA